MLNELKGGLGLLKERVRPDAPKGVPTSGEARRTMAQQDVSYYKQRLIVMELLRDFGNIFTGGGGVINFQELGPPGPEGWPMNSEYIRRFFQKHVEITTIGRRPLDDLEADSHAKVFSHWLRMSVVFPEGARAIAKVFFKEESGHKDLEWLKEQSKNENASEDLRKDVRTAIYAINALTADLMREELYVNFAKRRTIREEEAGERANQNIYVRFKELEAEGRKVKDIYDTLRVEVGLERSRLEKIVALKRQEEGMPRRERGRPKRDSAH